MHNFRELQVWKKGIQLVTDIYKITAQFPKQEEYGLISQLRRCAVSIPTNIAEGSGRSTNKDFARFLGISLGSAYELETHLVISVNLEFVSKEVAARLFQQVNELQKMLYSFIQKQR